MPKTADFAQITPRRLSRRLLTACAAVAFTLGLLGQPKPGAAVHDPQAVVRYVGTEGMATIGPNIPAAQRIASLRQLFTNYFAVGSLAEFALGRYRSTPTPQQRDEYLQLYSEYTVRNYAAQLSQYGAAPFRVSGSRGFGDETVVTSEVVRPGGTRVEIDWYLTVDRTGNYKIVDISIGGVSMRVTQRGEFAQWIETNGGRFGALLAVLRQQIVQTDGRH